MMVVQESGMRFGPYQEEDFFPIEHSSLHEKLGNGFKICEFLLVREDKLLCLEAKTSAPNPHTVLTDPDKGFALYINELVEKFENTLELFLGSKLGFPHLTVPSQDTPKLMSLEDVCHFKIRFCLVIKNQKTEYLPPVREALVKKLRRKLKIWNAEVIVLNEDIARKRKLIS